MQKIISIVLLSLILNPCSGFSTEITPAEVNEIEALNSKYDWLYKILMPEDLQGTKESKKSFGVHLRDSVSEFPAPEKLKFLKIASDKKLFLVTGSITYVGFFPKAYRYSTEVLADGSLKFIVNVYFKNATDQQFKDMQIKIKKAQDLWNQNLYDFGLKYQLRFAATKNPKNSHFRVNLKAKTRGPYDTNWSLGWSEKTIAHEIGHMLGLGDEYQTLTSKIDCIKESMMCAGSKQLPFHHYHVLRRVFIPKAIRD